MRKRNDDREVDKTYKASDVKEATGLTYRQLNDWEDRGAIPENEDRGSKWRAYYPKDVFILMVMAEFRRQYGIPVEKLKFINESMSQEGADHFRYAVEKMKLLGVSIWLITDFSETFLMDTELEISDMFSLGFFHSDKDKGLFLLNLTPLVQKLVAALKIPIDLDLHTFGFQLRADIAAQTTAVNMSEIELLQHVREEKITSIEIAMNDGSIKTVKVSQKRDVASELSDLLAENDYQQITFRKRDGTVTEVEQTFTYKTKDKK